MVAAKGDRPDLPLTGHLSPYSKVLSDIFALGASTVKFKVIHSSLVSQITRRGYVESGNGRCE